MTNGFSNDRPNDNQLCGFLPYRLGKKIIYCNRPTPDVLWYERLNNENIKVEALSFVSSSGGLVALEIYAAERYEEIKWKMGLLLRGPHDQVFHFECGLDTVFAKGMMWGLCGADENELRSGKIGIVPMPADPTKSKSKNPDKILYCNLFLNGRELPYFPGGTEHNWRELATIAMHKCNGYIPDSADIPSNDIFMDEKATEKYNKKYGSQPSTTPKTLQPARQNYQTARSGVTYPNQPLRGQPAPAESVSTQQAIVKQQQMSADLERDREAERARQQQFEELSGKYNDLFVSLEQTYIANGLEIDRKRLQIVIARGAVETFEELTLTRKHQIVATLARELLTEKAPNNLAIEVLTEIVTPNPYTPEHFDQLKDVMAAGFADLIPF